MYNNFLLILCTLQWSMRFLNFKGDRAEIPALHASCPWGTVPQVPSSHIVERIVQYSTDAPKFELAYDFEKDGVPASWAPGDSGPRQWGFEDRKISLTGRPTALAISPDGAHIAVAVGGLISIHDSTTLELQKTLREHVDHISHLAFHPGPARLLLSASSSSGRNLVPNIRLWDLDKDWDTFTTAMLEASAAALRTQRAWSVDDVAAASLALRAGIEELFRSAENTRNGQRGTVFAGSIAGLNSRPFSHDGTLVFYLPDCNRTEIAVYDVREREERFRLRAHTGAVMWVESSPNDTLIVSASWDSTVKLWHAGTGALLRTLTLAEEIQLWAAQFSPDGRVLAAGAGVGKVYVWSVETGEMLHALKDDSIGTVTTLDFTVGQDGDALYLAAGGSYGVRVFDVRSGERVQQWEVKNQGQQVPRRMYRVTDVRYSPAGFTPHVLGIKASESRFVLYDAERNVKWQFEPPPTDASRFFWAGHMVFNPATGTIVSADEDSALRVWQL